MFLTIQQMQDRIKQLKYKDCKFEIYEGAFEGPHLKIVTIEDDSTKPGEKVELQIHSWIPPYETIQGFDMFVLKRLIRIATHEAMEFFQDETGKPVVDPHRSLADRDLI